MKETAELAGLGYKGQWKQLAEPNGSFVMNRPGTEKLIFHYHTHGEDRKLPYSNSAPSPFGYIQSFRSWYYA